MNLKYETDLIRNFPRIFRRMSAATHDLEVCVRFHNCEDKHYFMIHNFCNVAQSYLDYMNESTQTKIPQIVIEEAKYLDNRIHLVYTGGDDYVRSLINEHLQTGK